MTGTGPAGETTLADVRSRLALVLARLDDQAAAHDGEVLTVAAEREPVGDDDANRNLE